MKVTVVIPNYNGIKYIENCLNSLRFQRGCDFKVIVVDNYSTDGSYELIKKRYPEVNLIRLSQNTGFSKAVNVGIKIADTPYVILLNNDTQVLPGFVQVLVRSIERSSNIFSVSAKMLQMSKPRYMDDGGDFYTACGWAVARGKDQLECHFQERTEIFAACAGAAIYRRNVLAKIGFFDEMHFAYLEDIDVGYRARILGYRNFFEPKAKVFHVGSGSSGSRYNEFKVKLSSANNIYLIYKNMPFFQLVLNLPFLVCGFLIKWMFFQSKGLGQVYCKGILDGFRKCNTKEGRKRKVTYQSKNLSHYVRIQIELWKNLFAFLICRES